MPLPPIKECPLCGEDMRLEVKERTERIPGLGVAEARMVGEWICPECDHFEEADEQEAER